MASAPTWTERSVPARETVPGRRPPLLVLLHGIGADENDLLPLARRFDPRFAIVSLRAPRAYHGGFAWFRIDFLSDGRIVPDVAGHTRRSRTSSAGSRRRRRGSGPIPSGPSSSASARGR